MCPNEPSNRSQFMRRAFLEAGVALAGVAAAGPLLAQQPPATAARGAGVKREGSDARGNRCLGSALFVDHHSSFLPRSVDQHPSAL